jgi:hypothetical protein
MAFMCTTTVAIDAERVVPRQNRAKWLEAHGPTKGKIKFEVCAPAQVWTEAGCHIAVDGSVLRVSRFAIDALCIPARDIVRDHFPLTTIPTEAATAALGKAATRLKSPTVERGPLRPDQVRRLATQWVRDHCDVDVNNLVIAGHDPVLLVLHNVVDRFTKDLGVRPLVRGAHDLETRYNASRMSREVRQALRDASRDFQDKPSFVRVRVREVARMRNAPFGRMFATVVPVSFTAPGVDPLIVIWDAEKPI